MFTLSHCSCYLLFILFLSLEHSCFIVVEYNLVWNFKCDISIQLKFCYMNYINMELVYDTYIFIHLFCDLLLVIIPKE